MLAQDFTLDDSVPASNLDGVPLATVRFGIPGVKLSFSQPVTVSMEVGSEYNGYLLVVQSLTEGGEAWANETTCEVVGGRIQFTVNHATRFAASVAAPTISGLTSSAGPVGTRVTISGKGSLGATKVSFNGVPATLHVDSGSLITATVPATAATAATGRVAVTTPAGAATSTLTFTVTVPPKPAISRFRPASGLRGAVVIVIGKSFGKKRGQSVVKFGTRTCGKYFSWSATRIEFRVPARARFGRLKVRVITAAGTSNARIFTVKRRS